ncbi:hypothetical protein [Azospirillum sp. TSO22-1]|uniref:hypothetical protein n=1 Tax=Azospirillum sp. TSO22-1 TaxID=716789 RepID=UPI000D610DEE|nr:hypothetical protein [Azospirillum sp. TSO22-1]PWC42089.1 hypothetical protein TSO221_22490 [Azospirillum sp. TSO22-1]
MNVLLRLGGAVAAAFLAMVLVCSQPMAQADKRVPVTPSTTEQKAKFVTNLVSHSVASKTIESSGDDAARKALANSRALVEAAKQDIANSKYEQADAKLNQAVDGVMTHSRRLSEGSVKADRAQEVYTSRVASVKALMDAYTRVADEKKQAGKAAERKAAIQQTLNEAEAMAAKGNKEGALVVVERAYTAVSKEVAALRDGDKLTKTLKFDSPADEYVYEIDRNDSHFFLLKLTISEKNPDPMILKQVEDLRGKAQGIRNDAEARAKKNDHKKAIDELGQSTDILIRALRMAGAYIPG